jgi:hypothetical protein
MIAPQRRLRQIPFADMPDDESRLTSSLHQPRNLAAFNTGWGVATSVPILHAATKTLGEDRHRQFPPLKFVLIARRDEISHTEVVELERSQVQS